MDTKEIAERYFGGNEGIVIDFVWLANVAIEDYVEGRDYAFELSEELHDDHEYKSYYNAFDYLNNCYGPIPARTILNNIIKEIKGNG